MGLDPGEDLLQPGDTVQRRSRADPPHCAVTREKPQTEPPSAPTVGRGSLWTLPGVNAVFGRSHRSVQKERHSAPLRNPGSCPPMFSSGEHRGDGGALRAEPPISPARKNDTVCIEVPKRKTPVHSLYAMCRRFLPRVLRCFLSEIDEAFDGLYWQCIYYKKENRYSRWTKIVLVGVYKSTRHRRNFPCRVLALAVA